MVARRFIVCGVLYNVPRSNHMSHSINITHDASLRSWVDSANDPASDFPIQNLPFGVFRRGGAAPGMIAIGVAIGDQILDISSAAQAGFFDGDAADAARRCGSSMLHAYMAMGRKYWSALRAQLVRLLRADTEQGRKAARMDALLLPQAEAEMSKPAYIGDFVDFFASRHHAKRAGEIAGKGLPANYDWMPLAYHGRTASIMLSGAPVTRPQGVVWNSASGAPHLAPTRRLDYEAEIGFFVGRSVPLGQSVPVDAADDILFGACLLNDWSARDIQRIESDPLGPFLAKSFATTISPWVVSMEALAPFRVPAAHHETLLPHLDGALDRAQGGLNIELQVALGTAAMRAAGVGPQRISSTSLAHQHWTPGQLLAHLCSNGGGARYGDLLGTGTVSGPTLEEAGCLLELTLGGRQPLALPNGETRAFLEDGDEVQLSARCSREGFRSIGFGSCTSRIN